MLYAIVAHHAAQDYVKFGIARNVEARKGELQVGCPLFLEIHGTIDFPDEDELLVHTAFEGLRVRGEWFILLPRVQHFIDIMSCHWETKEQQFKAAYDYLMGQMETEEQIERIFHRVSGSAMRHMYA
jgi:hypothetical protein